ncbi:DUF2059 domain-containing protein [Duganella aceris]|uniref:DUF2059 domain-containing protein n=1 Tax=Duganella aceris TaxID=2703883 RepID=A0ABX0FT94_9BURK|nr:DUF2059 domain-containing protein [Duganella aceris]NGZ87755.1 DUF2059 domain-containing protein [Duganella aceris]
MKKIIASIFASVVLAGAAPVFAQSAPVASAAAPAADPAALAAAREMFDAMNYSTLLSGMMRQMGQGIGSSMRAGAEAAINNNAKMSAEQKKQALAKMETELPAAINALQGLMNDQTVVDEILSETVPLYARTYTADELKQITAFYRTPVGAKMLATTPQLMQAGMQIGQQVFVRRVGPLMEKLQAQQTKKP